MTVSQWEQVVADRDAAMKRKKDIFYEFWKSNKNL